MRLNAPKKVVWWISIILVVLGIYLYGQLGGGEATPGMAEEGDKTSFKCASCGHTLERDTAELQRLSPSPIPGMIALTEDMVKCPKCGKLTLEIVSDAKR